MKNSMKDRTSERDSAGVKFLAILLALVLLAHAGYQYIPTAYQGASFKQEMDTAVVKGLAASGQLKASFDYQIPGDAIVDVLPMQGHIQAHVSYQKSINMLPFGLYKYNYKFDYTATPTGYLLKEN